MMLMMMMIMMSLGLLVDPVFQAGVVYCSFAFVPYGSFKYTFTIVIGWAEGEDDLPYHP